MNLLKIDFQKTQAFSSLFLDYVNSDARLKDFYGLKPQVESFEQQIFDKASTTSASLESRQALHQAIFQQYENISIEGGIPTKQIDKLLHPKTFTVTTGHQLNIFTGPLYFIYKIVTTINLARTLKEHYPDYHFVPVYWMATEDHDFAEINHFHLFAKAYTWETNQKGAVGHFETKEIQAILEQIPEALPVFEKAYLESPNLSVATRKIVHTLFPQEGLICLDGDDTILKKNFLPFIKDDIFNQKTNEWVSQNSEKLTQQGYKSQVYPRKINFFYLDKGIRERIVEGENGTFEVLNTEIKFTKDELNILLNEHPEKFSPNVIMRPVYQEYILPNLAYVGGPGELAYWLQLKDAFDQYKISFPILMPRNFALILNKTNAKKLTKLGVEVESLFLEATTLKNKFLQENTEEELSLEEEVRRVEEVFVQIAERVEGIDVSLQGFVGAEKQKALKSLKNIEKRLKKSEEQKLATEIKQLLSLKEKLFPSGKLQERHDNFLTFYMNQPDFIKLLLEHFDSFDFRMAIFVENS